MMKVGVNYLSLRHLDIEGFFKTAHAWNLDIVDTHRRAFPDTHPEELLRIKMLSLKYGLPLGYMGVSNNFVGDDEKLASEVEKCKEAIDVAALVGQPLIRVFGGRPPKEAEDLEPYWPPLIRCMHEVANYAAEKNMIVGLQNHDNNNLASTADQVLRILEETDRPNFGLIMDTGQWKGSIGAGPLGEYDPDVDIYEHIERCAPHCIYLRTKFYRNDSGQEEWLDYERIFSIMSGVGYNGCISIQYEGESDPMEAIPKAIAQLRDLISRYS